MNISNQSAEVVMRTAVTAQYGGAGAGFYFGMTANEFAALGGVLIGVVGLLVNVYFKWQHLKLAREQRKADADE